MFTQLSLAAIATAVSASSYGYGAPSVQQVTKTNFGGSSMGNRLVDDLHDGYHDPTSPYGHSHISGTHSDHGHGLKNGWGIGHSHQYLTPTRDYVNHEHGDGLQGPGGRYADQAGGRYGLSHRWGQYSGIGHGHNPAGGHGWGDHDDHDVGDGHGMRVTWGRGIHGHGPGAAGQYRGSYGAPQRVTRRDNLSSTYRLPSETDYNRVRRISYAPTYQSGGYY